jgi:hypothetical protein
MLATAENNKMAFDVLVLLAVDKERDIQLHWYKI